MEITPENLDELLKTKRLNRTDLAKLLGVSRTAVDTWFYRKKFPLERLLAIKSIFGDQPDYETQLDSVNNAIMIDISARDFRKLEDLALSEHKTVTNLATDILAEYVKKRYEEIQNETESSSPDWHKH